MDSIVLFGVGFNDDGHRGVELIVALCGFHHSRKCLNVAVAVDVVLPVLRNLVFGTRFVGKHVVALAVGRRFLQDVSYIKGRQVGIGLKHQRNRTCYPRCGHARAAEGHIAITGIVLCRHHVGTNKGNVGLDTKFFCGPLAAVDRNGSVLVQRTDRDDIFSTAGGPNGGGTGRISCGDEHGDASSHHFVSVAVDAVFFVRGPLDRARATKAHGSGTDVEFVAMVNRPLHARHDGGEAARTAGVKDLHTHEEGLRGHAGMVKGGCTCSRHGTGTMRAVALVVVGLDFSTVGFVGVVHCVIEGDDLRVVGAVVIVLVVEASVKAVNARIDDGNGDTCAVVARLLLGDVNAVDNGCVSVLNLENAVKFQHDHARECGGLKNQIVRDAAGDGVDERQVPLVDVPDLSLEHGDVLLGWRVVEINDQRECVGLVQKQGMVVVFLDHVGNLVVVLVHVRGFPPCFSTIGCCGLMNRCSRGQQWCKHQKKAKHAEEWTLHENLSVLLHSKEGFQFIGHASEVMTRGLRC